MKKIILQGDCGFVRKACGNSNGTTPVVSSAYWNHVYGAQLEEVTGDKEKVLTNFICGNHLQFLTG